MLPNKLKKQMINFCVQIYNLVKTDALMNRVDQASEISECIIFKKSLVVTIHVVYIPFTNFEYCYEITNKNTFICVNLIKECTTFNGSMIVFNPNIVFI
jgi:hypothetical protein